MILLLGSSVCLVELKQEALGKPTVFLVALLFFIFTLVGRDLPPTRYFHLSTPTISYSGRSLLP